MKSEQVNEDSYYELKILISLNLFPQQTALIVTQTCSL